MIMVRQNELACRDEWSRSLWTPGQGAAEAEKTFQRPPLLGPAPPANVENVRKMLIDDAMTPPLPEQGEDVLLSEARIVSEVLDAPALKERPAPMGGFDPRTAVFRAREAYRERSRARESAARLSAGAEAIGISRERGEPRTVGGASTFEVQNSESEVVQAAPAFHDEVLLAEREPFAESTALDAYAGTHGVPPPWGTDEATFEAEIWARSVSGVTPDRSEGRRRPPARPIDDAVAEKSLPAQHERASGPVDERSSEVQAASLPEWFRTDLPRTCRTCRDFRPSADGGRGWCANAWAFTHRRLVQEDDVAPCDSSIGDWWAPVDDVWLVAADVSSHGRATPLLDRSTGAPEERRRRS